MQQKKAPKVSVCVITYNQKKYIRQCLQSIVEQETDFDFEVILGDDCSTDGTREIVKEFAGKYPTTIRVILQNVNTGGSKNNLDVHAAAVGEYIAHVDGDDYIFSGKLQAQVNYLDLHPNCNIVWHRMMVKNEVTGKVVEDLIDLDTFSKRGFNGGFNRADILRFVTIGANSSKMYRSAIRKFDFPDFPVLDFFMNVEHVGSGVACFVSDVPFGVYRAGIGIASSGNTSKVLLKKSFLYFANKYPKYKRDIASAALLLFLAALKNRKWSNCIMFMSVLTMTFRFESLIGLWRNRDIISMFRIPAAIRETALKR